MADDEAPPYVYAERMFPAPGRPGIAEPDRAVCSRAARHVDATSRARAARASSWYEGGGARRRARRAGHHDLPADRVAWRRRAIPSSPCKIGMLIDMDLGQLLADWIDPTILAIEDALNEGVYSRGPIQLVIADARGLPRENYRKVIDGYRWLVEQGCVVVLGPLISDNSPRRAGHRQRARRRLHRLDRRPQVRLGVLLHRRQRRHPHRGRHVRPVDEGPRATRRSACSGSRAHPAATTPTTSATRRSGSASRSRAR